MRKVNSKIKRWYCPKCQVFKSISRRDEDPYYGFVDHRCRCCGTNMIDAKGTIRCNDILTIIKAAENKEES